VSAYTFYDGPKAFKRLAARMDAMPAVQVTLLLNIQRKANETSAVPELVNRFADRFWRQEWPGERRPAVFYDPRSLATTGAEGVLHAKALVVDDEAAFVTSANLTEAAFDRNLELGVLSRDRTLASGLARHFRILIDQDRLLPLSAG
jgi:phosphatidylserine/phosphatidylglycerophosphate/cardiolipin synthase-like enzyme